MINNENDYDHLIERIYNSGMLIARALKRKGLSNDETEELTTKIMLDAVAAVHKLRKKESLDAWLRVIAQNAAKAYFREQSKRRENELSAVVIEEGDELCLFDTIPEGKTVEDIVVEAENRQELGKLIDTLSSNERKVLLLKAVEKMKHREIAAIVGIKENSVKSVYRRAVRKMKERLEESKREEDQ